MEVKGRDCEVIGWLGDDGGVEVLSVPLNLESGQGEQTEGERTHSTPSCTRK